MAQKVLIAALRQIVGKINILLIIVLSFSCDPLKSNRTSRDNFREFDLCGYRLYKDPKAGICFASYGSVNGFRIECSEYDRCKKSQ